MARGAQDSDIAVGSLGGMLAEEDLEVIDALQVNPRASWTDLGAALGIDPVTASRRWQRLHQAGEAWVTAALGQRQLHAMAVAFLELDCEAGAAEDVSDSLVEAGHLISVQHVAGSYDLWVLAVSASQAALAEALLRGVPRLPGVRRVRTHMATRVFDASRRWRLRVVSQDAANAVAATPGRPDSTRGMDDIDRALFTALSTDGRATWTELAHDVGLTARSVQRRVNRLVATGDIDFRCDLARPLAGWRAAAVLWVDVPDAALEATGRALVRWPETRTCAAIAGPSNLMLTVGLHSLADLHPLVTRLGEEFPHAKIRDRQAVLRQTKLYGRILDVDGRWVRSVPVDPWHVPRYGR
jgi:DNA-binding Lrp family transcriptional regulator